MKKMKVITIVGTRPEIIKLSETLKKLDENFEHVLVHTGQNYDYTLNEVFFEEFKLREPNYYLNAVGSNLGETIGLIISKSYEILVREKPDALLVLGDTNSCLSVISAKRLKIPIFHMEAGNRCFDENLPEEINRKIVDHTSDVNLCYSEHARRNLINEGKTADKIFVVGSPMAEILKVNEKLIEESNILSNLNILPKEYILLSAHREENIDNETNFTKLMNTINIIAEKYKMPIIYSAHPRSRKKIDERNFNFHRNVIVSEPFSFSDYIKLQKNAFCVISDSGTLAEESSYFKFPAVSIRTSTERQEVFDKGNLILGSLKSNHVLQALELAVKFENNKDHGNEVENYNDLNVSLKLVKIIQSYTNVINEMVWRK